MLVLEIVAILLTAVVMSLSLAHALELPGKMRLNREAYLTTQTIYYPGFTIGGIAEPLAVIVVFALLLSTSPRQRAFLVAFAFAGRAGGRADHLLVLGSTRQQDLAQGSSPRPSGRGILWQAKRRGGR
jgi:hypothetical protein